jgi:hypothetical protein
MNPRDPDVFFLRALSEELFTLYRNTSGNQFAAMSTVSHIAAAN